MFTQSNFNRQAYANAVNKELWDTIQTHGLRVAHRLSKHGDLSRRIRVANGTAFPTAEEVRDYAP